MVCENRKAILLELEVLMVTVAMQLMVGQMIKAAKTTHKFIKMSHWLLKVGGFPSNFAGSSSQGCG